MKLEEKRKQASVLGYPVDLVDMPGAIERIERAWYEKSSMHVVTLNAEMTMQCRSNQELGQIISSADLIVPDGAGVVFAIKFRGGQLKNVRRLPGVELAEQALHQASSKNQKVAVLGGRPEVMQKLKEVLPQKHPGINVVAFQDGFLAKEDEESVVAAIAAQEPALLLVALGVPRQEFFIAKHRAKFPHTVMIGVGGSFDVWTGFVQRAPESYQKFHLEWLYRLLKEPWRFQRMASTLPPFAILAMMENLSGAYKR